MAEVDTRENMEHAEHAEHVAHLGDPFMVKVSVTIAFLAVFTAAVGSLETIETAGVTVAKNEAVLLQNKASDAWTFYQARSIKKNMYEIAAANGGPSADDFRKQAKGYGDAQEDIKKQAEGYEHNSEARLAASEGHEHRHHILTIAVTMLQISIAVATIAIITKGMRWPWYASIALGLAGLCTAASAYIL
ncbi:MAG: DUF4337 domain-containing protein [Hyphomicrobiales bacterium]|nr:DUF4337 domain-containing protein [Hyphomicrobiales bacterium]